MEKEIAKTLDRLEGEVEAPLVTPVHWEEDEQTPGDVFDVVEMYEGWDPALVDAGILSQDEFDAHGRWDTFDIVMALREMMAQMSRESRKRNVPTGAEFCERYGVPRSAVVAKFGDWQTVLDCCVSQPAQCPHYPTNELIEEVQRISHAVDEISKEAITELGLYSWSPYSRFDSLKALCEEAGVDYNGRESVSNKELIADIRRVANKVGRRPISSDMRAHGEFAYSTAIDRWGSWDQALEAAGYAPYDDSWSEEEIVEWLETYEDVCGRAPTVEDIRSSETGPTMYRIRQHFDGLRDARQAAGL